jgi:hypothetical protein|tara:strand:+ start:20714 stop:20857 length:144 start_codon:yes stop_codon:yes gene_type:complete
VSILYKFGIKSKIGIRKKIARKKYSPQFKDLALERSEKEGVPQVAKD